MRALPLRLSVLLATTLVACNKGEPSPSSTSSAAPSPPRSSAAAAPVPAPPKPSAAPAPAAEGGACGFDETYEAVGYACKGEKKQAFPAFLRWTFKMNGTESSFTEAFSAPIPRCTNVQPFKATCAGSPAQLTLTPPGPGTCDPPNCLRSAKPGEPTPCTKTPSPILWSLVERTPSSLTLTSVEPFKLTTCTSMHKENPLTVWWQKK